MAIARTLQPIRCSRRKGPSTKLSPRLKSALWLSANMRRRKTPSPSPSSRSPERKARRRPIQQQAEEPIHQVMREGRPMLDAGRKVDADALFVLLDAFEFEFQCVLHEKYPSSCCPGFGVQFTDTGSFLQLLILLLVSINSIKSVSMNIILLPKS